MVARDLGTGNVTEPVNRKKNPDYKKDDGSPQYLADEPHLGSVNNAEPKPQTVPSGFVRGGTSNPPKGQSGEVERFGVEKGHDIAAPTGESSKDGTKGDK